MSIASALRSVLCVLGIALSVSFSPVVAQTTTSTAIDGFDPNVDGPVYALAAQPDGKILIAGLFKTLTPNGGAMVGNINTQKNIARVLPDGRIDDSFNANVDGQINAMVLQPDGKILIGGSFTSVNGSPATYTPGQSHLRIARLNANGTTDATFQGNVQPAGPDLATSLTPEVRAIALQTDGKVLVGGGFVQSVNGTTVQRLMRLNDDGSFDTTFTLPNPDNTVMAIKPDRLGRILIGGAFRNLQYSGTPTVRNAIARLNGDGSLDDSFRAGASRSVFVIETQPDDYILIGGEFDVFTKSSAYGNGEGGTPAGRLVRVDPSGNFGSGDNVFYANFDGPVRAIQVQPDGRIVVAGAFNSARDSTRRFVARVLPNGLTDSSFIPFPNFEVDALALQPNGSVVIGGAFITMGGTAADSLLRNHVARVTPQGFTDATFRPEASGRVRSLTVLSHTARKRILIGGTFTAIAGETHNGVAAMNPDGTLDRSFTVDANGPVLAAVEQDDGKILLVGAFNRVNGVYRNYIARLNADYSLDDFNPAPNGQVNAVAVDGTAIYIGGNFSGLAPLGSTTTYSQAYFAKLNADGSLDINYHPQFNNSVQTIAVQSDHKLLIGGSFTSVRGSGETTAVSRYSVARLNTDGKVEATFHPNVGGVVYALLPQADGSVVVAGSFTQAIPDLTNLKDRWNILRIKADGTLDDAFDPRPNATVYSLAQLSDGSILLGGLFTTFRPKGGDVLPGDFTYAAKLSANGDVDTSFHVNIDQLAGNEVVAVAASPSEGKALIAGAFTTVSTGSGANTVTVARNRLVQVTNAGAVDTTFTPDIGNATGAAIEALTLLSDESILAAGSFSGLSGTSTSGLARFYADGEPVTGFVPNVRGTVHAIGQFATKGEPVPTQRRGFAWLEPNGQLRSTYVPGADPSVFGTVTAMALEPAGTVIVGGSFNTAGAPDTLARFKPDGSIDSSFLPRATGTISAIAVQSDGKILIGGSFNTIQTVTRNNLARLNADGSLDKSFDPYANASVTGIVLQSDGKIVVCGAFSTFAPNGASTTTARYSIARLNSDGTVDTAFDPNPNSTVTTVAVLPNGKILAGGGFTAFAPNHGKTSTEVRYLALINSDGTVDSTDFKLNGSVTRLLAQPDGRVLVGGAFTSLRGEPRNYLGRLNSDLSLDSGFNPNPNSLIYTMALDSLGRIIIGGAFTALQPNSANYDPALATPRYRAARLNADGSIDTSFNPNFDSSLSVVLAASDNSVIAAGIFTTVQPSGSLLIGGAFTEVNSVKVNNLAVMGGDGSVSSALLPEPNGPVFAVLPQPDGRAVVGGAFTQIAGVARNRIARFNADDTFDASFNPNANGDVYTLARQPDGKVIVGGAFTNIGGQIRNYLARLNSDGSVDGSFAASVGGFVRSVALQSDGKVLYIADGPAGSPSNVLGRLNSDGVVDGSFSARNTGIVDAIAVQADGSIVVGGKFTAIGGGARSNLARLKPNGDLDQTITSQPNGEVTCVTIQLDGKILFGGKFSTVDGQPRFGLARVATTVAPTMSFSASQDRSTVVWTRGGAQPEVSSASFERSSDYITWTDLGQASRVAGTPNWQISGLSLPVGQPIYLRVTATIPVSPNASSGLLQAYGAVAASNLPVIGGGTLVSATTGTAFNYTIVASGSPTGYSAANLPAGLTLNATTGLISGTPTQTGTFSVTITATNASGSTSKALVIIVTAPGQTDTSGRIINLSVRGQVSSGKPIVAGFVVRGGAAMNLLVRGVGPTLSALGVASPLATPNLKIYDGHNLLVKEVNAWGGDETIRTESLRLGAYPLAAGSADAAILATLNPGGYTFHVTGPNDTAGTALGELYDASVTPVPANAPRLVNISARSDVYRQADGTEQTLTAGFVITGSTTKRVLIRGLGPALLAQGVTTVLVDPALTLYHRVNGVETVEAQNNDWGTPVNSVYTGKSAAEIAAAASAAGAPALGTNSRDASILVDLPPGIYSAVVSSAGNATAAGAMVEVYEVP
jgi:uncharacterized delta-60 repeat protein